MMKHALVLSAGLGLAAVSMAARADVEFRVEVGAPPPAVIYAPPPRVDYIPSPRPGYAWVPGQWVWDYNRYVWVGGYWTVAQPVVSPFPPRYLPSYGHHHRREWREREHERRPDPRAYPPDWPRGSQAPRR